MQSPSDQASDAVKRLHISTSELQSLSSGEIYFEIGNKRSDSRAFYLKDKPKLCVLLSRVSGAVSVTLSIFDEAGRELSKEILYPTARDGMDLYTKKLSCEVGLYFFTLSLECLTGTLYIGDGRDGIYLSEKEIKHQLLLARDPKASPKHRGGIIYHIFVDRFSRDDNAVAKPGAVIVDDWSSIPEYPEYAGAPLKNNTFYGGTLYSAAKRLDYIASLGANIVYLSPVFESPSNHRYDTSDYMQVDKMLGSDEGLQHFINEARARGIGVILDGVFNHTGADSIYFNRYGSFDSIGAYQSELSPYYGWYSFKKHPDDYEAWWGIEILPRINTGNPDFEQFILEKVIPKYRDMGILGLRLDVADELSDDFIKKIKSALGESSVLFGEVWEDASNKIAYNTRKRYYLGGELDGVMNYPLRTGIIDYMRNARTEALYYALTDIVRNAPKDVRDMQMNLLGTHDTQRIITALAADSPKGLSNTELSTMRMTPEQRLRGERLLMAAYTVISLLPGLSTVFYADEAALEGYSDPFNRMPYPCDPSLAVLEHYKRIGTLRRALDMLSDADFKLVELTGDRLIFARVKGSAVILTVYNNSDAPDSVEFPRSTAELISGTSARIHTVRPKSASVFKTNAVFLNELTQNL